MLRPRDDFSSATKQALQNRVGSRCSNPNCRASTAGPQVDPARTLNIGVAAHITAASPDGPRYDPALTAEQRCAPTNGIWLCQNCAKLVDNDPARFSVQVLHAWKNEAEEAALREIGQPTSAVLQVTTSRPVVVLEYDCNLQETPEKPFTLNNVSSAPAYEAEISSLEYKEDRAEFRAVPAVGAHDKVEVPAELPNENLFFKWSLRILLDKMWLQERWLPAQSVSKEEVERLFKQPVVLAVKVRYKGADHTEYIEDFELVYIYFAARAFIRFASRDATA